MKTCTDNRQPRRETKSGLHAVADRYADTGQRINYGQLGRDIEAQLRTKESSVLPGKPGKIKVHVVGFGKLVGDLIEGLHQVMAYFGVAAAIAAVIIFGYTRCVRSTVLVLGCSLVAVIWQLGLVRLLGFELDPYSVLVPFLVFAIGVSHGAQKMNGIMQDVGRGERINTWPRATPSAACFWPASPR